jgi:hypothetical protein
MPLFEFECVACDFFAEEYFTLACPYCDKDLVKKASGLTLVGPTPTNPVVVSDIGRTFTSPAQMAAYEAEHGVQFYGRGGRRDKEIAEGLHGAAEKTLSDRTGQTFGGYLERKRKAAPVQHAGVGEARHLAEQRAKTNAQ